MTGAFLVYNDVAKLFFRQDTKNIIIPNLAEVFPAKLMDYVIFAQARESAAVCARGGTVRQFFYLFLPSQQFSHFLSVPEHITGL